MENWRATATNYLEKHLSFPEIAMKANLSGEYIGVKELTMMKAKILNMLAIGSKENQMAKGLPLGARNLNFPAGITMENGKTD